MGKVHIKGLKISEELCLVRLRKTAPADRLVPAFCGLLSGSRINMPFMTTAFKEGRMQAACCVAAADRVSLKRLIDSDPKLSPMVVFTREVGLLTIYPHHSSLELFGHSLRALFKAGLQVHAMASSIGALTYVLDYRQLEKAAAVIEIRFDLGDNHAPFRAEFVVAQGTQSRPGTPNK